STESGTGRSAGSEDGGTAGADERWRADPDAALAEVGCPECESDLVNVQGILSCRSCRWTDAELDALRSPRAKLVYLSLVDGPKSVDAIRVALDLKAGAAYGILRTLTDRELVERRPDGTYRLRREGRGSVLDVRNG
ncbi:hypothetical protein, partial [Halovivax sp.]|uniref:hypothetical protein n=1 Tax=Halovivax sp. TaxID=1935978 RepID=UPI00374377DE